MRVFTFLYYEYLKYLLDNKSEVLYEYLNKETRKNLSS